MLTADTADALLFAVMRDCEGGSISISVDHPNLSNAPHFLHLPPS